MDGITPSAPFNAGKGNSAGSETRHIESQINAGGTATITTPGALTLKEVMVSADRNYGDSALNSSVSACGWLVWGRSRCTELQ